MVRGRIFWAAVVVAAVSIAGSAPAETRYVSDVLLVNLRERPDGAAPTIRLLRTGEAMDVLEVRGGFLHVRTAQGEEGWVADQYVTTELPKAMVIAQLQNETGKLRARLRDLEAARDQVAAELEAVKKSQSESSSELQQALSDARTEAQATAAKLQDVQGKYDELRQASQEVFQVTEERDTLRGENERLRDENQRLTGEKAKLTRAWATRWFLTGAGVLLVGWVLGALTRKKKARFTVG
jgi:SH3 domain protein